MKTEAVKTNLQKYYDLEAEYRSAGEKQSWKKNLRKEFCDLLSAEKKKTLLEIGAGAGQDSRFFMDSGFVVTAVDISGEMVKQCKQRDVDAFKLDFYELSSLNKKFDSVWAMNCLLHVPKSDLPRVLKNIDNVLNENGLFYMGVYGGKNSEEELSDDFSEIPRFFSSYIESDVIEILQDIFTVISFEQIDGSKIDTSIDFQSIIMRKK